MRVMMKTAKQERSRQTFAQIVEATERLLEQKLFDEISVAAIVNEAGATVGSFYNLFDDKNALLPHLYRNHCEKLLDELEKTRKRFRATQESLVNVVEYLVKAIIQLNQQQRGLMRALVLRAHCHPTGSPERNHKMTQVLPELAKIVAEFGSEISHPRPRLAAKLGLLAVLSTVREVCLYPNTSANSLDVKERDLTRELARMWLGYLTNNY